MSRFRARVACAALAACALLLAGSALAQSLILKNIVLDRQDREFTVGFDLSIWDVDEVRATLENGVPLVLTCTAKLDRHVAYWFDDAVAERQFQSRLGYDTLTGQYTLDLPGRSAPLSAPTLPEVIAMGWQQITIDLGPSEALLHGEQYSLSLTLTLSQTDVPDWFSRLLFFMNWELVPTTAYQLDFNA